MRFSPLLTGMSRWRLVGVSLAVGVAVAAGVVGSMWLERRHELAAMAVPQAVAARALFLVYVPSQLPRGFAVDVSRYTYTDPALLGGATNEAGEVMVWSEVALPADLDVGGTFGSQLHGARRLTGLPYQTITGTLTNGEHILSVAAATTWIIFTYRANLDDAALRVMASHLVLQK